MANRTVKDAKTVKGTNPQYLIEKIIRCRIYDSKYWKEECFALTAELLVDKAMELRYLGGVYGGNIKPAPFLCLVLKMLQIQPEKDIVIEFIKQEDFKYIRALGAYYMRLTGTSLDCFNYLEPLLNDYRKLRVQGRDGKFFLQHMDEFIDGLLRDERVFDIILPRIQKRYVHEETNELEPRVSLLEEDLDEVGSEEEREAAEEIPSSTSRPSDRDRDRDRDRERRDRDRRRRDRSRSPVDRDRSDRRRERDHRSEREHHREHRDHRDHHRDHRSRYESDRRGGGGYSSSGRERDRAGRRY